jgi:hypothetical protein
VSDINRTLNPFKDVRVSFAFSYPFAHPDLARYRQRLDEGVRALLHDIQPLGKEVQGVSWNSKGKDGRILTVRIHEGSCLFPDLSSERLAFEVFLRRGLILKFFRAPINPSTLDFWTAQTSR